MQLDTWAGLYWRDAFCHRYVSTCGPAHTLVSAESRIRLRSSRPLAPAGACLPRQIYQLIATRSVHDISITWSLLYNGGLILTTVYLFKVGTLLGASSGTQHSHATFLHVVQQPRVLAATLSRTVCRPVIAPLCTHACVTTSHWQPQHMLGTPTSHQHPQPQTGHCCLCCCWQDAPGAWLPSIFELAGGLLVLGLKLFFEHTAVGRRMTAARLQQQQAQAQQEQQALEEQEQEQWKLQQQGKHMAGSETLDLRLNLVFSDDSAAGLGSSVLELQEEAYGSSSTDGGRELILAGASAEPGAAGPSPRQRGARKPPGLLLRLPTQRLGVDIRTAYPLSPLPCQSVTGLKHQSSAARHSSAPGSMRERGAAAHAASNGQAPHLADSSRLQGGSATHSPNTPRAATVAGGVNWGSVSEGGTSCSALCPTPRGAARPVSGGKDPA